jgi:hypothetical protein
MCGGSRDAQIGGVGPDGAVAAAGVGFDVKVVDVECLEDRRRHMVSLTPNGIRRLTELQNALPDAEQRVLAVLDSDQQATLRALLEQIAANSAECSEHVSSAVDRRA